MKDGQIYFADHLNVLVHSAAGLNRLQQLLRRLLTHGLS